MSPKIVALVPMRHNSERVPSKNYRNFAGKPLYHCIIESLSACPQISRIVIDTDSPIILKDASRHFPHVDLIQRPAHLTFGETPMNEVLKHDIGRVEADFYLQTHSTNPLLRTETIYRGIEKFLQMQPVYDSLFSVTRLQTRLWDPLTRAINHNPDILLRTQDLPPVYEENSCLYIFSGQTLSSLHNRIGKRPYMFEIDRLESLDIDEEIDFRIAEFMYKKMKNGESNSYEDQGTHQRSVHAAGHSAL